MKEQSLPECVLRRMTFISIFLTQKTFGVMFCQSIIINNDIIDVKKSLITETNASKQTMAI